MLLLLLPRTKEGHGKKNSHAPSTMIKRNQQLLYIDAMALPGLSHLRQGRLSTQRSLIKLGRPRLYWCTGDEPPFISETRPGFGHQTRQIREDVCGKSLSLTRSLFLLLLLFSSFSSHPSPFRRNTYTGLYHRLADIMPGRSRHTRNGRRETYVGRVRPKRK